MNILVEEVERGKWRVNVVPTSEDEIAAGAPSGGKIGLILLDVASDLLGKHVAATTTESQVIEIPRPGLELPPGV